MGTVNYNALLGFVGMIAVVFIVFGIIGLWSTFGRWRGYPRSYDPSRKEELKVVATGSFLLVLGIIILVATILILFFSPYTTTN